MIHVLFPIGSSKNPSGLSRGFPNHPQNPGMIKLYQHNFINYYLWGLDLLIVDPSQAAFRINALDYSAPCCQKHMYIQYDIQYNKRNELWQVHQWLPNSRCFLCIPSHWRKFSGDIWPGHPRSMGHLWGVGNQHSYGKW